MIMGYIYICHPQDSPGKNTGVGGHDLLQGILPAQELNPCLLWLLHCTWILYSLNPMGSPIYIISSVTQSCPTPCNPMEWSTPGFPVHQLPEPAQTHAHRVGDHLILFRPLLLLPSIFPSIRDFSNESVLCIRWPKYWSFSISPSNEYSGLISFRIDWLDLLAVQGTVKSLHSSKASILQLS